MQSEKIISARLSVLIGLFLLVGLISCGGTLLLVHYYSNTLGLPSSAFRTNVGNDVLQVQASPSLTQSSNDVQQYGSNDEAFFVTRVYTDHLLQPPMFSDWLTYENKTTHFTFKYSPRWTYKESTAEERVQGGRILYLYPIGGDYRNDALLTIDDYPSSSPPQLDLDKKPFVVKYSSCGYENNIEMRGEYACRFFGVFSYYWQNREYELHLFMSDQINPELDALLQTLSVLE